MRKALVIRGDSAALVISPFESRGGEPPPRQIPGPVGKVTRFLTLALLIRKDPLRRQGGNPGMLDSSPVSPALVMSEASFAVQAPDPTLFAQAAAPVILDLSGVEVVHSWGLLCELVILVTALAALRSKTAGALGRLAW